MILVSIPQAVSTVATHKKPISVHVSSEMGGFNTASGKYCCNSTEIDDKYQRRMATVSIPQAVSTVATAGENLRAKIVDFSFNTASGKYCCNNSHNFIVTLREYAGFNTASGKYCCNLSLETKINGYSNANSFNTASGKYCCNG